ncbi:hypothetical protein G4B88_012166 [Cannabis sativa]|uniref:Uncharacterized protein n=1 Tax=Cannabis sativa TaxID=3483 RepID=A0A7J6I5N5_CANSA|nr:hypothetical protein G4B88_012166 [Cannabis sativa]
MGNKNTNTMALSIMLVILTGALSQTGEAVSECAKGCMDFCLKERATTIPACEIACENYCGQVTPNQDSHKGSRVEMQGRGARQGSGSGYVVEDQTEVEVGIRVQVQMSRFGFKFRSMLMSWDWRATRLEVFYDHWTWSKEIARFCTVAYSPCANIPVSGVVDIPVSGVADIPVSGVAEPLNFASHTAAAPELNPTTQPLPTIPETQPISSPDPACIIPDIPTHAPQMTLQSIPESSHTVCHDTVHDWFRSLMSINNGDQIEEASYMVVSSIWNARNNLPWNQKFVTIAIVILSAHLNLYQWKCGQKSRMEPLLSSQRARG